MWCTVLLYKHFKPKSHSQLFDCYKMDPFRNLSDENLSQIKKYLRFFGQKKDGMIRSVANDFLDAKNDKLQENMYSKDDVEDFCDFLSSSVKVR